MLTIGQVPPTVGHSVTCTEPNAGDTTFGVKEALSLHVAGPVTPRQLPGLAANGATESIAETVKPASIVNAIVFDFVFCSFTRPKSAAGPPEVACPRMSKATALSHELSVN